MLSFSILLVLPLCMNYFDVLHVIYFVFLNYLETPLLISAFFLEILCLVSRYFGIFFFCFCYEFVEKLCSMVIRVMNITSYKLSCFIFFLHFLNLMEKKIKFRVETKAGQQWFGILLLGCIQLGIFTHCLLYF